MSNVRTLALDDKKILIGEYSINREAEQEATRLLQTDYPGLIIVSSPEGKKQVPLQDIIILDRRFRTQLKVAEERAAAEGMKRGYRQGLEEGREEARRAVASLSGLLRDITAQRHTLLAEAKEKILELILKISRRLTFAAVEINPDVTMAIISGTIDQLLDKRQIKVKVHPDHLAVVEQNIDNFRGNDTTIKEFNFEPDPRIRVGGCFIETPSGDIDARLESMYDVIRQAILDGEDAVT